MIRVLGGKFKGKKLNNFKLESLRPTKAIVRKSIMDTLMPFENKNILDLFSGVGTLGIEALSRGARSVCFVDKNPQAIKLGDFFIIKSLQIYTLNKKCMTSPSCTI